MTERRASRVDLRLKAEEKDMLMCAADLRGLSLSAFLRQAAIKMVDETVEKPDSIILSDRDRDLFLDALADPPEAAPRLKVALERYYQSREQT